MNLFENVFLVTFISSLILFLLALMFMIFFVIRNRQCKDLKKKRTKNKSKRKKIAQELNLVASKKKKSFYASIVFLTLSLIFGGCAYYVSYYQAINLSDADSELVVRGYYLLSDFEKQLNEIKEGNLERDKAVQNIQNLGGSMASYNNVRASGINKEEGQLQLNRYYNILKEIGSNAVPQSQQFFDNKELIDEFLKDVEKAKNYQENVFDYYKVDGKLLKNNE